MLAKHFLDIGLAIKPILDTKTVAEQSLNIRIAIEPPLYAELVVEESLDKCLVV